MCALAWQLDSTVPQDSLRPALKQILIHFISSLENIPDELDTSPQNRAPVRDSSEGAWNHGLNVKMKHRRPVLLKALSDHLNAPAQPCLGGIAHADLAAAARQLVASGEKPEPWAPAGSSSACCPAALLGLSASAGPGCTPSSSEVPFNPCPSVRGDLLALSGVQQKGCGE